MRVGKAGVMEICYVEVVDKQIHVWYGFAAAAYAVGITHYARGVP